MNLMDYKFTFFKFHLYIFTYERVEKICLFLELSVLRFVSLIQIGSLSLPRKSMGTCADKYESFLRLYEQ